MKKISLVVAILAVFTVSWVASPTVVSAGPGFLTGCIVNTVGAGAGSFSGYAPIQMTCSGDSLRNYQIEAGDATGINRVLAALFTALSAEKTVMVYVNETTADVPGIQVVYVQK